MTAPHMNCLCGRWCWKWVSTTERANGVLIDKWQCQSCGSTVTDAYNPPSEDAQVNDMCPVCGFNDWHYNRAEGYYFCGTCEAVDVR